MNSLDKKLFLYYKILLLDTFKGISENICTKTLFTLFLICCHMATSAGKGIVRNWKN